MRCCMLWHLPIPHQQYDGNNSCEKKYFFYELYKVLLHGYWKIVVGENVGYKNLIFSHGLADEKIHSKDDSK